MTSDGPRPDSLIALIRKLVDQEEFSPGEVFRVCRPFAGGNSADREVLNEMVGEVVTLVRELRGLTFPPPAPVALVRRDRKKGDDWFTHSSWLGGLPTLDGEPWPRGRGGNPLHHIARLDLAEIKMAAPHLPLPDDGTLSLFYAEIDGRSDGAVRFALPGKNTKTSPPHDMLPAYEEEGGYPFPSVRSQIVCDQFPYWPLEAIPLDLPLTLPEPSLDHKSNELIWDAQLAALHGRFPKRNYDFGVDSARNACIAGTNSIWWHGAILMRDNLALGCNRLNDSCRRQEETVSNLRVRLAGRDRTEFNDENDLARREQYIAEQSAFLAKLQRTLCEIGPFKEAFDSFVTGREPWAELTEADIAQLEQFRARLQHELRLAYPGNPPFSLDSIRNVSIERLMTETEEFFAKLPDDLVAFINDGYRTPTRNFHHMFGLGTDVQEAPYRHLGDHLLLQIAYDSLAQMRFGDVGAVQFWIAPKDLDAQRWDKVKVTLEGH